MHQLDTHQKVKVTRRRLAAVSRSNIRGLTDAQTKYLPVAASELNVDNWNDNCEAKSEAKSPRPSRGLQVDSSLTHNVSYAVT